MITLPTNGAIIVGKVVDAFQIPKSFPAFSREGNTSIDSAQFTLVYAPYPNPNNSPNNQSHVMRVFGKITNANAARLIHSVAKHTTGARRLKRSDKIPDTKPLTTAPPNASSATIPVASTKFARCWTHAK